MPRASTHLSVGAEPRHLGDHGAGTTGGWELSPGTWGTTGRLDSNLLTNSWGLWGK